MAGLRGKTARLLVVLLLFGSTACSSIAEQVEEALDDNDIPAAAEDWFALTQAFHDWADNADGGGVAFVRDAQGRFNFLTAGDDPKTGLPLDQTQRLRVGSISKIFTAVMVMQLVDEGVIELDAPISTYVDDLEIANDVTVRQLLAHETGIPNYTDSRGFREVVLNNPERKPAPADLIAFTNSESDFDPGSQFAYSNTNFIVAGMLVEAITGMSLNDALAERVSRPLGFVDTTFDDGTVTRVAGGYSQLTPSGNSFDQSYTSIAYGSWAAGGMVTTVEELALFLDALFFGELISAASLAEMIAGLDEGAEYGLGLHSGPDFGVGHDGSIIGFNSVAEVDLDTKEMIIVVVNNDGRDPKVASSVLAEVLSGSS